jgi:tellurite resistance protein TehA-like permease
MTPALKHRIPGLQLLQHPKISQVATILGMLMFAVVHRGAETPAPLSDAHQLQINAFATFGALALIFAMTAGLTRLMVRNEWTPLLVALGGTAASIYAPSSWALLLAACVLMLPLAALATARRAAGGGENGK